MREQGPAKVFVEFFGIPRIRVGRREYQARSGTVGSILAELQENCSGLGELCDPEGLLCPQYLLSLDGTRFLMDPTEEVPVGSRLILLSADVGG